MMVKRRVMYFVPILAVMLGTALHDQNASAQSYPSTVTFLNGSAEDAVVKLVGPSAQYVEVPNGKNATVHVAPGEYRIVVQYRGKNGRYTYSKGDPFDVIESGSQYSVIRITLHKVFNGNYRTRPATRDEFGGR